MSLMDGCGNFNEVAPKEFGSANIAAFHSATMGTTGVTFSVNGADPDASASIGGPSVDKGFTL